MTSISTTTTTTLKRKQSNKRFTFVFPSIYELDRLHILNVNKACTTIQKDLTNHLNSDKPFVYFIYCIDNSMTVAYEYVKEQLLHPMHPLYHYYDWVFEDSKDKRDPLKYPCKVSCYKRLKLIHPFTMTAYPNPPLLVQLELPKRRSNSSTYTCRTCRKEE